MKDAFESDFESVMSAPWKIKVSGLLAFSPIWGLLLGLVFIFSGVESISRAGLGFLAFAVGARVTMGLVFSIRVLRTRHYTSSERMLWIVGLLIFFPIATIPFYWHREIWQDFQDERFLMQEDTRTRS